MNSPAIPSFRYQIFFLIMLMALLNYIDRGAIAYASASILPEYGFDKADWGNVLGYFGYGYILGALVGGILADRFGAKRIWLIAGATWSIFEIATAFAGDFGLAFLGGSAMAGFATIRVMFGFAEGPAYSVINKSVANWATPKERGFVVSVGLLSTPLGALLTAPVAVGLQTLTGSWRSMFVVLGVASLALLIYFMTRFTNTPDENPRVSKAELDFLRKERAEAANASTPTTSVAPVWHFFKNKDLLLNAVGYFSFVYVTFLLLTWTPKYLQDEFHYNLSSLWYMGMIPWTGACFTVLLGGKISDWLLRRTGNLKVARSWLAATCLLLTTLCFIMVSQAQTVWGVIALMTLANALNALPNSVYWAVVIDTAPSNRVGAYSGMTHFIANTASFIAPMLTGYLTVHYGYSSMFVAAAVATALGMSAMLMVRPGGRQVAPPFVPAAV
ncbi:MFS transporter [Pseudomonas fluorescens]|uniref:MFS transporter n=1 Tax=Pseudomonas TaxID=286 RepID=UPI000E03F4DF|nr:MULTISPECIES: MFS transporter [Pseudomonas]AYG07608.1 MFS transporter [Pseudomonas fluorescens]MBJ2268098.1 MFS transporter [Pseudomonas sp. MF6772]MBL7229159.1 MFS transporter [Pseudomonas sp.]MCU0213825.1 MFS transporter [Pseudomonas shahriarae]MDD0977746.1 MFS transporter [Pseudomonas shahriarae]